MATETAVVKAQSDGDDDDLLESLRKFAEVESQNLIDASSSTRRVLTRCLSYSGDFMADVGLHADTASVENRSRCLSVDAAIPKKTKRAQSFTESFVGWVLSTPTTSNSDKLDQKQESDNDDSSTESEAYYDWTDFKPYYWENAADMLPTLGIAVVASGIAIFHPFFFVAGALTAFGTVQAVGAGYDFCTGGTMCKLFYGDDESETKKKTVNDDGDEAEQWKALNNVVSSDDIIEEDWTKVLDETTTTVATSIDAGSVQDVRLSPPNIISGDDALELVDQQYPTLKHPAAVNVEFVGLNAMEFFHVFFANDAPFSNIGFQRKRGDQNIEYGLWENLPNVKQFSLHHKAGPCGDLQYDSFEERVLTFKAKTNSYFGPPYATTTKVQRALLVSKKLLVLESKTTVTDIPFADRFYVMERWNIVAEKVGSRYISKLSVSSEVFLTKSCPFEAQIRSKSKETISEVVTAWCVMAQEALKQTELHRLERIRNESGWDEEKDDELEPAKANSDEEECVEVQHIGACRSWVVGEDRPDSPEELGPKIIISPCATPKTGNRRRLSSLGRSITRIVRKRKSEPISFSPELDPPITPAY